MSERRFGADVGSDHGDRAAEDLLAARLSQLARRLHTAPDSEALLTQVVTAARELVPGSDEGSVSDAIGRHGVHHRAPSSDFAHQVDQVMTRTGQGPCLDAIRLERSVRFADLSSDTRWPEFARFAIQLGARSILSLQLHAGGNTLGALNLYSRVPNAFTGRSESVGLLLAAHAAIAYASAAKVENLEIAIDRRNAIGTAVGIVMQRYGIDPDRAFQVLVRHSQAANRKLADIAAEIVGDPEAGLG